MLLLLLISSNYELEGTILGTVQFISISIYYMYNDGQNGCCLKLLVYHKQARLQPLCPSLSVEKIDF